MLQAIRILYEDDIPSIVCCACLLAWQMPVSDVQLAVQTKMDIKHVRSTLHTLYSAKLIEKRANSHWIMDEACVRNRLREWLTEVQTELSKAKSDTEDFFCAACSAPVAAMDVLEQLRDGTEALECPTCSETLTSSETTDTDAISTDVERILRLL